MPPSRHLSDSLRQQVRERARGLCEYCHAIEKWQHTRFTIDHVIPLQKAGRSDLDNLALACFHCNRRKSNLVAVFEPTIGRAILLFNPRLHEWSQNFIWSLDKLRIIGLSDIGTVTIKTLDFNRERVILIRSADLEVDRHPPPDDLVQGS